jgi:hypothetical protein
VTFLDVMDGSIVNVALPTIRTHLGFTLRASNTRGEPAATPEPQRDLEPACDPA